MVPNGHKVVLSIEVDRTGIRMLDTARAALHTLELLKQLVGTPAEGADVLAVALLAYHKWGAFSATEHLVKILRERNDFAKSLDAEIDGLDGLGL